MIGEIPSFILFNQLCSAAAMMHGAVVEHFSNGALHISIGTENASPVLFVSGLHGDERSGPLAILELLQSDLVSVCKHAEIRLHLCPLLNDEGWDKAAREWRGLDLNRTMRSEVAAPSFIAELMQEIIHSPPVLYADLHEDSDVSYPYVFRCTTDQHDLADRLGKHLEAKLELWSHEDLWAGSSEVFVRSTGCRRSTTLEAPPSWPIQKRVRWHLDALRWLLEQPIVNSVA